jgi:hypothetical protein
MEHKEHVVTNEQGTLLGIPGPAWALAYLIAIAAFVIFSVFVLGDPNWG